MQKQATFPDTQDTVSHTETYPGYEDVLRKAGLRPTEQRIFLMRFLFPKEATKEAKNFRHVTAEMLRKEVQAMDGQQYVSFATMYNTLNRLAEVGLIKRLLIGERVTYFDTNPEPHQHLYCPEDGTLINFKTSMSSAVEEASLSVPSGYMSVDCSLVITLRKTVEQIQLT